MNSKKNSFTPPNPGGGSLPGYCLLFLILFTFTGFSFAEKKAAFTEFVNPFSIVIDGERLYISEGVTVFIYSLEDYHLIKKFGKEGEGPGEVMLRRDRGNTEIGVSTTSDFLIVHTSGKVMYFTKEGKFVKEKRTEPAGRWLAPLGSGFVGRKYSRETDALYHSIVLWDTDLNKIKDVYKHIHGLQGARKEFNPLTVEPADYTIADNKIFVIDGDRSEIMVYDKNGDILFTVTPQNEDEPVPFTKENKQDLIDSFKFNPLWKRFYERRPDLFKFPAHFPPIRMYALDTPAKKIYLKTQTLENDKRKWLVYDFNGKFIKKRLLPRGLIRFYNDTCYRFVENEDEELWELYVEKID